ncbi:MAG: hypothetical protein Q9183_007474, partial [Haloplaca sp. 2 TL-2023]
DGFDLGDLRQYILVMESFQKHYAEYWTWKGELLGPGVFGSLDQVGLATFGIDHSTRQPALDAGVQMSGEWQAEQ